MTEWRDEPLDRRRVCQKRRRVAAGEPQPLDALPAEWRELLARWVQRNGKSRWETLRKDAGATNVQRADDLLGWLMRAGWAAAVEQWKHGAWWPQQVELLHLPQLRAALGLRDRDDDAQRWQEIRARLEALESPVFSMAIAALDGLPVSRALARAELIFRLHDWHTRQRSGTRRDFALFARGGTKAVTDAEWNWLEAALDLAEFNIERHTPLLLVAAPLTLVTPLGRIELAASPDFAALTPATAGMATAALGRVAHWHLIENRTSFERLARQREAGIGVIWLPGYPPGWWREAMGCLLGLAPAPARISCDPDPSGMAIALKAAEAWQSRGLDWQPWKMSASDLAALPARKPLTDADRQQLAALLSGSALPPALAELGEWMMRHNEKGEQEGYL